MKVKEADPDKSRLVDGLTQLVQAQMKKIEGVFEKLKKHLPKNELKTPKEKAFSCLSDLINWVKINFILIRNFNLFTIKFIDC